MAMVLSQQLKMTQQLLMTPQLQQAIKLLQLSRLELVETIRQEMEQNPLLEEVETVAESEIGLDAEVLSPNAEAGSEPAKTSEITVGESASMEDFNWDDYTNQYESGFSFSREAPDPNRPNRLDFVSKKPGLHSHLQWQISHSDLDEGEKDAAYFVIGNLNRHGFLEVTVEDIVSELGCSETVARDAIAKVQDLDPPGVGSKNVQESLLSQLKQLGFGDSLPALIIREHLHSLEIKNFSAIAKATNTSVADVRAAVEVITSLNPYPGRAFSDEDTIYIVPDVYVHKVGDEYLIVLNDEDLPRLQISSEYQCVLDNKQDDKDKGYIQAKMKEAAWLIKSIQQRQRTIYKVVESILKFQKDFFERGVAYLKPMILRDVADDISMHESTVSRITSNKYVHTPQGLFELKFFFSAAIHNRAGEDMAAESIRARIRDMIKTEPSEKPLTDNAISKLFAAEKIMVARRTVAKYREQLGILPVKNRRNPK